MSRRLIPRDKLFPRSRLLGLALGLAVGAIMALGVGRPVLAFTLLIGAFLAVALAKRA